MAPVEKHETGEFVDDENFRRQPRDRRPFPFGHDGLARAENAEGGVLARCEFAKEAPALGGAGVIFYAIHAAAETCGHGLVASEQIEFHGFAVDLVEQRDESVERAARSALDQEHAREGRDVAAEEIAQGFILRDREILVNGISPRMDAGSANSRVSRRVLLSSAFQRSFEGPLWRH